MVERQFFGWRVVAGAFLLAIFAWGVGFYGPGLFIATLAAQGWSLALLSAAVTWHFLVSAVLVALLPEAHRRFGIAGSTRAGALASAIGLVGWALAPGGAIGLLGAATLTGIGWALTSGPAINAMIAPWFEKRRPMALSLAYNGASLGGMALTPALAALTVAWGFGPAAGLVAGLMVLVIWPLAGAVLGQTPAGRGVLVDGLAPAAPGPARSRRALLRDPRFRGLSVAFALGLFAQMSLVAHLLALLTPALGVDGAGLALSLVTLAALIGRTVTGWLLPAGPRRRHAAAITFAVQALGSLALILADGTLVPLLLLGSVFFGFGVGNLLSLPPLIVQAEFPPAELGRVVALLGAINQAVYAMAPVTFGLLLVTASSNLALGLVAGLQLLAGLLVLRRPRA